MTGDDIDFDDIDDREQLIDVLRVMQNQLQDAEARVRDLQETRSNLYNQIEDNTAKIERLEARIEDLGGHIEVVDASIDTPRKGKVENVLAVIEHAHERGTRGMKGTMLKTGEVHAAISGSRTTALRLIDEIAATFEWAQAENPGGQRQKRLKLEFNRYIDALKTDVASHYANQGEATG